MAIVIIETTDTDLIDDLLEDIGKWVPPEGIKIVSEQYESEIRELLEEAQKDSEVQELQDVDELEKDRMVYAAPAPR